VSDDRQIPIPVNFIAPAAGPPPTAGPDPHDSAGEAEPRRSRGEAQPAESSVSSRSPDACDLTPEIERPFIPPLSGRGPRPGSAPSRSRRSLKPSTTPEPAITPEQRLLILDAWRRCGLPAGDFAPLVGISKHTLYAWQKRFQESGPAGLMDQPRGGPRGSRLPEVTRRAILMLKESNPDWGCQKISDMLLRGPALPACPSAVARVLHEAGYKFEEVPTRSHSPKENRFERANPNQMWQTDLFTFILKRQNRRVYLVAFLDDHSRFIVGYGLHASQSTALVIEVLRAALGGYGVPGEVLTDNGTQYVTWRGKSAFSKECDKHGIKQIVASPHRPQTLGKIERFWGTLWRECVETAVFADLGDARQRIGLFIDHYNFSRPHQGIESLTPADRFFGAAEEVKRTLAARVHSNALELARHGLPKAPFYLTGQAGGQPFSVHAEGERVILTNAGGRQEIDLLPPAAGSGSELRAEPVCPQGIPSGPETGFEEPPGPGASPLDEGLAKLQSIVRPEASEGGAS
jgi:transposase InsO family protein